MIRITTNVKSTKKFLHNAKVNIMRSQTKLAKRMGEFTKAEVEFLAPEWEGTLKSKVAMKVFPRTHKAEVMMASQHFDMVAMQNEYNIGGRRKLYKTSYPKIARWAQSKNVFTDKPYVIVGGSGTRLGKQNKFFYPAFLNIQKAIPDVAREVISQAIMRTRG